MQAHRFIGYRFGEGARDCQSARIKLAVVQVEAHPYLLQWELLEFCQQHGIVLLAFAALGHGMEPKLLENPVITGIAQRVGKIPAQVVLAWAIQRGTALLTTSTTPRYIQQNFEVSALLEDAMIEIRDGIATRVQLNAVVETGVPGFIPAKSRKVRHQPVAPVWREKHAMLERL
jgi:diketogulonate reductase-like aldo/keto reductase